MGVGVVTVEVIRLVNVFTACAQENGVYGFVEALDSNVLAKPKGGMRALQFTTLHLLTERRHDCQYDDTSINPTIWTPEGETTTFVNLCLRHQKCSHLTLIT